jgi:tetratricopeptide (TPR) repeat protein
MNRTIRPLARRIILLAGMVTCITASAFAQGSVQGLVRDDDGNGISGATVTAENLTSATSLTVTTDDAGRFSFIVMSRGEWRFFIRAYGFEPALGSASVRGSNSDVRVQFTMKWDRFNPQAPETGLLAGLTARELVESLDVADELIARGEYDAAIDAYQSILERAPNLTSLGLQIGHAFHEKQEPDRALAAFRTVLDADPSNAEARVAIDAISQTVR